MDLFQKCSNFTLAREAQRQGYYPYFQPISESADTEVVIHGRRIIMVGSNNYLGLTHHPKVVEAAQAAISRYGSGCTGSRFLNGTLDLHEQLEERLARFMRTEAALVFSTGYQTNLGTIAGLVGRDDVVITDKLDHASIVDGCHMAFGEWMRFKHNDLEDLRKTLEKIDGEGGRLIVVDGVFSMEGDIAPLPQIVKLAKEFDCRLMVDDAHSIGVLGARGAGTAEHFGLEKEVDIVMGTFSKSFASIGGFIAGPELVIHYLKHNSRPLIFSASMPPASVATVLAALEIIENEPDRRARLWANARRMLKEFRSLGFDTGVTETPIIPVIVGNNELTFRFWKRLFEEGVFTNPVVSPAVPENASRLRTSYMATHTDAHLDFVLEKFRKVGREAGLIG
jgi:8-amino-7-oxononanoate synthase